VDAEAAAALRQELEERLKRPVSDAVWEMLVEERYAEEVLRSYDDDERAQRFDELVARARRLEKFGARMGASSARARPEPVAVRSSGDRGEAAAELLAADGRRLPQVRRFRQDILQGHLIAPDAVPAWVRAQAERDGLPGGGAPLLKYPEVQGEAWISVHPAGVLGKLRNVVQVLSLSYGWDQAEAVRFVLCDTPPTLPARAFHRQGIFPCASGRILLDLPPWVSDDEVLSLYHQGKHNAGLAHQKPLSSKIAALVQFVCRRLGENGQPVGGWATVWQEWNAAYPQWRYATWQQMCSDFRRKEHALLGDSPP